MIRVPRLGALLATACLALAANAETPAPVDAAPPAPDLAPAAVPVAERLAEIQRRVQAALRYPESARARGVAGEARVGFEVSEQGRAQDVRLLASSGSSALDRAATRAVRDADPLPRVIGRVAIPVRFELAAPGSERSD